MSSLRLLEDLSLRVPGASREFHLWLAEFLLPFTGPGTHPLESPGMLQLLPAHGLWDREVVRGREAAVGLCPLHATTALGLNPTYCSDIAA